MKRKTSSYVQVKILILNFIFKCSLLEFLGVLSLIDEILESEAKLAVLTCTQSDDRDEIWKSLASQLGDRVAEIRPIQWPEFQSEEFEPFSEDSLRKDIREVN